MLISLMRVLVTLFLITSPLSMAANDDLTRALQASQQQEFLPVDEAYNVELQSYQDTIAIEFSIAPGYYLYRHRFSIIDSTGNPVIFDIPAGEAKNDEFFGDVEVYYQFVDLRLNPNNLSDTPQQLNITYQGCADAGLCYPPETIETYWDPSSQHLKMGPLPAATSTNDQNTSLWLALILALAGGAILNLMPCVFPVLSLKALSLLQQHEKHPIQHGLSYTAGVVISFISIAALMLSLRSAGEGIGWGFQLQSPIIIAALSYVFFILALNLSGFFEFNISFSGAGQSLTQGNGLGASFATGVLAALVASPCTAPFMGTALAYALTQPSLIALSIFGALGLGLALPFLLISMAPNLAKILPAPGMWMQSLREFLAFPLYLTVVWLLWIINHQSNSNAVAMVMVGGVAITMGIWAWKNSPWHKIISLSLFVIALSILASPQLSINKSSSENLQFDESQITQAISEGHPVFVNITADWCITCLVNERNTLSSERVETLFAEKGIVYIKGDWTKPSPTINDYLNKHNRSGVPLYVAYYKNQVTILPQILTTDAVLNAFGE
jgi:thiol:disulfide interchange protein